LTPGMALTPFRSIKGRGSNQPSTLPLDQSFRYLTNIKLKD